MPANYEKHENACNCDYHCDCDYPSCQNATETACDLCAAQHCDRHGDAVRPEGGNKCWSCGGYNADAPREAFNALLTRFSAQRQLGPFATVDDADSGWLREAA